MNNTAYYAAELMVYFEKHRLLEVLRVFILRIGLDRPLCVRHYIRRHFRKIASSVLTKNSIIQIRQQFDVDGFVRNCLQMYKIPIITYNTRGTPVDQKRLEEILRKFEKFCRRHGIDNKDKIYLNFPESFSQVLSSCNCNSPPLNLIHVTTEELGCPDFRDIPHGNMNTYQVNCSDADKIPEKDVISKIMYKIKHAPNQLPFDISANFVFRVVMLGLRGSGARTQAKLLAARFNLVYLNIETMVSQTLQKMDNMWRVLCISYKQTNRFSSSSITALVWKRLLEKDALARGWVIVGFPKCENEMKTFVEKYITPPNRVVVVHCSKSLAMKRLIRKWEKSKNLPKTEANTTTFVEREYALYDGNKAAMYAYLKKSAVKTIHVDGSAEACAVRNKIFALVGR